MQTFSSRTIKVGNVYDNIAKINNETFYTRVIFYIKSTEAKICLTQTSVRVNFDPESSDVFLYSLKCE